MKVTVKVVSVNEFPRYAVNRVVNRGLGYTELPSKVSHQFALCMTSANVANGCRVEFGQFLRRSVLRCHVLGVIGARAEKQVVRADAGRIVTVVTDEHAIGDRAVVQFPTDAVSELGCLASGSCVESPVTLGHAISFPLPTSVTTLNVLPERFFNGSRVVADVARMAAISPWVTRPGANFFTAIGTGAHLAWAAARSVLGDGGDVTGVGTVQTPTRSDFARVDEELDATRLACTSDERVATLGGHVLSLLNRLGAVVPGVYQHRPASSILPKPTYPRHFSAIGGVGCA